MGNVKVEGPLDALKGNLELASAGAKVAGNFQADVTHDPLRYSATAALSGIDLHQWLGNKDLTGVVSGTIEAAGTGFALQSTSAKAHLQVHSTTVQKWALGTVSMDGRLQNNVAAIDGRLQGKAGTADWSGKITLSSKQPSYDLTLAVKDLDVQNAAPGGNAPRAKLNFRGSIRGAGLNLAAM